MTLKYLVGGTIRGQSNDAKPTTVPQGTKLEEIDTGRIYIFDGSTWKYWTDTEEGKIFRQKQNNGEGSPLIRLTGDGFAQNAESSLYLLDDLNSEIGGGVLTNNNAATFVEESELPLRGFNVVNLDGVDQYLSRATEAQFEVGAGSFIASIFHKNSTLLTAETIFSYGDIQASEQNWLMEITSAGILQCTIDDGTNAVTVSDTIPSRWQDGRYHCFTMLVDRTTNIMYLFADGQIVASGSISAVTLTLDNVGENFYIGARDNAGVGQYGIGQFANFHLIKSADYNAIAVLNQGIRERVAISQTAPSLSINAGTRLNNVFQFGGDDADYVTTVIDVEDGEYEIQEFNIHAADLGKIELYIDDNLIRTAVDLYNATPTYNNKTTTLGIKIGVGKHILKLKVNGKNASSSDHLIEYQWINLIKRNGHENGGVTEFLLLGDEIEQRVSNALTHDNLTSGYYDNEMYTTTPAINSYTEGDLFLKGGLWEIEYVYRKTSEAGKTDLDFGSVEVLNQLDQYNSPNVNNNVQKAYVRLNQGKQNIRLANNDKNASSTDYQFRLGAIRGRRINE